MSELRDKARLRPVCLAEIALKNSGPTLYLSDKNITVGSQQYEDYLSGFSGAQLSFKNDRFKTYGHLIELGDVYPFEGAACTIKEICIGDDGTPSEPEIIFKGLLDEPYDIDLAGFKCRVRKMEMTSDRGF